ncbi:MAG TPA: sigma-70 family RNA polymerase sigma factor [Chitinophagaceae bacterium]|jgi:RNA polymerase sigma-70 factor (ECF subfamily)|nr:sigma-70 family RNA polymerase sigma factor [Chitinophagaceae bacterium]
MLYEVKTLPVKLSSSRSGRIQNEGSSDYINDKVLWEGFKSGDELAFIQIYKSYCNILYNYGCQFTYDKELVRDCLQDFFIYLRKNKAGFGETSSIKMYLLKAFRRRVIEYFKKTNSEIRNNKEFSFVQFSVEMSFESVYINQQAKAEEINKLNAALKSLDSKEREAIYYFYYEGLSYEQIASILNFSHVSSARRVMYRGLRHLRGFLANKDRS